MTIRVFLADDHAVVRDGLRLILDARPDITVIGDAADGREAVRQVAELRPDVVVMDISMPGLNGIEATRQIRGNCPSVKVIVLSMHDSPEYVFQAMKAGAQGYLLKESAGREVVAAVRSVYMGLRHLSHKIVAVVIDDYLEHRKRPVKSPLARLSGREREILQLIAEGKTTKETAEMLSLSQKTIETYRHRLMQKLKITDVAGLIKFAIRHGITSIG